VAGDRTDGPLKAKSAFAARIVVILVSLTVGLAVLAIHYVRLASAYNRLDVQVRGDFTIEEDPVLGYAPPRNGVTTRRKGGLEYHVYTDDRRCRVNHPHQPSADHVDLLTVGCSFSWGHGMENEATYTQQLASRLNISVANASLGSYGTVNSLLTLRNDLVLRPRVVVYGFIEDHLRRNVTPCAPTYGPYCLPTAFVSFAADGTPSIHPPGPGFEENRRFFQAFSYDRELTFKKVWVLARADLVRMFRRPVPPTKLAPGAEAVALSYLLAEMQL
jgi:hypothetical protein